MTQFFDPLNTLLQLLSPDLPHDQQYALLRPLDPQQWAALVSEAERQGVSPLLYSLLAGLESTHALTYPEKARLYQDYIATAAQNTLTLHDAEILLTTLQKSGIAAAGLKGIYLLEHVYGNIGARAMSDIDILIKKQDLAGCLTAMNDLGYSPDTYFSLDDENIDTKHVPPMEKPGSTLVEVHWTLLEENEPFTINADALWDRLKPAEIANVQALALSVEDLLLHLCLHLTYQHYLSLGLRGLLDVALVIHNFQEEIDWEKLARIAKSWGSERVTALTLKLVETQLNVPIPAQIYSALVPEGIEDALLENARIQLLERVQYSDHFTPDLVKLTKTDGLFSKVKIGLQRVFIPRLALARIYNVSPNSPKIIWYYFVRLKYLFKHYGKTLVRVQRGSEETEPALRMAEISNSLHSWMSSREN